MLEKKHIYPKIIEFSSINSLKKCLKRGLGVNIAPEIAVTMELEKGSLIKLNWEVQTFETTVLMIWHTEKWCSPLLRSFMELAKSRMQKR